MHSTYARAFSQLLLLCYLQYTAAIINRPFATETGANRQLGSNYLSQQRPLWILEDQVPQSDYAELSYTTQSPYGYRMQQPQPKQSQQNQQLQLPQNALHVRHSSQSIGQGTQQMHASSAHQQQPTRAPFLTRQQSQLPRVYKYSPLLQFPRRYLPMQRVHFKQRQRQQLARKQPRFIATNAVTPARRHEHYIPRINMPTFDSLPGDESVRETPVFIYTGPKGKLIMNTILTAPKYLMQEPVPGQVLYPPSVPIFRPKPIVERFRMPGSSETLNLTLIPFYAHEAIGVRQASRMLDDGQVGLNEEATTMQPAVLYAAPALTHPSADSVITASTSPAQKFRAKKAKHYSAYHSPKEVQWTPMASEQLKLITSTTTPFPLTAPSPPQNHRFITELEALSTTTPHFPNYKISYKSDTDSMEDGTEQDELLMNGDQLDAIYFDESLEKPTTAPTKPPMLSSRYSLSKEFYAFPVFTLGKLLKREKEGTEKAMPTFMVQNTVDSPLENTQQEHGEQTTQEDLVKDNVGAENSADNDEDDVETWFILNSKYKGQQTQSDNEYRLSSKYVQTTEVREPNGLNL